MVYSIIAHDLRSPFNGLMGLSELLLQNFDGFSNEKKKSSIHSIHQSSTTLNSLLGNLLGWSKIQTGKLDISQTLLS
ncbi:MAG: hypothetical protein PF517_10860 [Salinivirgaceae bacterium]|nr:hypothetical protein [Salinivirgaceae bacterium]